MDQWLILNTVPTYKEAPVSMDILSDNIPEIAEMIQSKNASRNVILIDQDEAKKINLSKKLTKEVPDLKIEMIPVDADYRIMCDNESAVLNLLKGVNPIPTSKEETGILIDVETSLSLDKKLVYIKGSKHYYGKKEIEKIITPQTILDLCNMKESFKGIYFGYPMGRFVAADTLDVPMEITTDLIYIYNEKDCILNELYKITKDYAKVSCGRCVFGYEGITQINLILSDIIHKKGKIEDLVKLKQLAEQMRVHTICEVGRVISTTIIDALTHFKNEIENHITQKTCHAMVCKAFVTYHILVSKCVGCSDCMDACNEEAILGKNRFVHVVVESECTHCGACMDVCERGAVVMAGATKPKCPKAPIPCRVS